MKIKSCIVRNYPGPEAEDFPEDASPSTRLQKVRHRGRVIATTGAATLLGRLLVELMLKVFGALIARLPDQSSVAVSQAWSSIVDSIAGGMQTLSIAVDETQVQGLLIVWASAAIGHEIFRIMTRPER